MLRFVLILAIAGCVCGFPHKTGNKGGKPNRIVGGTRADINNRPYQVSMILDDGKNSYLCGGSILSATKVLTAAHCVVDDIKTVTVRAGSNRYDSGGITRKTTNFTYHPQYSGSTHDYDVAIIDLQANPLTLNDKTIKAVKLTSAGSNTPDGTKVTVSGWGTTSENGQVSPTLMEVTVNKINQTTCSTSYRLTDRMLCAGVLQGGKDSCQGDSGGPLVLADKTQVGIVSFGIGCARPGVPGVYSNVAALRNWIKTESGV